MLVTDFLGPLINQFEFRWRAGAVITRTGRLLQWRFYENRRLCLMIPD